MNRIEALSKLNPKTLLAIASVSGGDGHTLFASSAYREAGMPEVPPTRANQARAAIEKATT